MDSFLISDILHDNSKQTYDNAMSQFKAHIGYLKDISSEKVVSQSELAGFAESIVVPSDPAFGELREVLDHQKLQRDHNKIQDKIRDLNGSTFVEIEVPEELIDILGV